MKKTLRGTPIEKAVAGGHAAEGPLPETPVGKRPPVSAQQTKKEKPGNKQQPQQAAGPAKKTAAAPAAAAGGGDDGGKKKARKASELDDIFAMTKRRGQAEAGGGDDASEATDGLGTASGNGDVNDELRELAERIKKAREAKGKAAVAQGSSKKSKVEGSKDDIFGAQTGKGRKRTEEGYAIYTEDELKLGAGGDTDLCPFDCDCCY
uniref:DUF1764 domain-containing protein n=1 Tax=Chlamydomonas euryale TaxID=1486919 RepID=A0A7R9V8Y4_9CHLO